MVCLGSPFVNREEQPTESRAPSPCGWPRTQPRELPNLPLEDALQLVHLYHEQGSPKAEPAARRWLLRYLSEGMPSLRGMAKVTASLASASSRRAG